MEIFEKQQTIEAIKTVVKARWFFITVAVIQVVLLKIIAGSASSLTLPRLALLAGTCYGYNFLYWLYLRRTPEKMGVVSLRAVRVLQVVGDMIVISMMLYFDQTVTIFVSAFFLDVVLIASVIYKKLGIFLTTFSACLLFTFLAYIEYLGYFPPLTALYYYGLKGNFVLLERTLILFYAGLAGAGFLSGCIAALFRKREKRLVEQTDVLTKQTEELTLTKNWLNNALIKSDTTRLEVTKTKEEMEKANLELKKKIEELEKFYRVTVGREVKMVELKSEIKNLKETIKKLKGQ